VLIQLDLFSKQKQEVGFGRLIGADTRKGKRGGNETNKRKSEERSSHKIGVVEEKVVLIGGKAKSHARDPLTARQVCLVRNRLPDKNVTNKK